MTHWPPGSGPPEQEGEESSLPEAPKPVVSPVLEPTDITYLMAVKPFLSPKARTVLDLLVNLFGKPGEAMNPTALLSLITTMVPSGRAEGLPAMSGLGAGDANPLMVLLSLMNAQNGGKK